MVLQLVNTNSLEVSTDSRIYRLVSSLSIFMNCKMANCVIFRTRSYPMQCPGVSALIRVALWCWPSLQSLKPVILLLLWHMGGGKAVWNLYYPRLHIFSSCWLLHIHSLGWTLCDVPYCCLCRMKMLAFHELFLELRDWRLRPQ